MGVLNRLIGDQRKLYQAREQPAYFFKDIEPLVRFEDKVSNINSEITYIRNVTGSTDQNSYTGMIKVNDPIFSSDYSPEFWGVLALELDELYEFIISETEVTNRIEQNPLTIIARLEEINKMKPVDNVGRAAQAFVKLQKIFADFKGENAKKQIMPKGLYCSGLYFQLDQLSKKYDVCTATTKSGKISGISKNGFTKKDFMDKYTTGRKKKIWGNPFIYKIRVKGKGEVTSVLKKASGKLEIEIPVETEQAMEIQKMIENAGVSSFYLGKKGLAYVSNIRI